MLRQAGGDADQLDRENAELHRLTAQVSLDKSIGDDGDATLGDLIANGDASPEDAVMAEAEGDLIDELLGVLDERSRFAVASRFGFLDGEKHSFREIGEHLGITSEAARRLTNRALESLRGDAERLLAA
jgi:RNA polymerase primary sigma factor